MFNFENVENVTNKQLQLADIKVFAGNKIRIGEEARKKLNLTEGRNIIIQRAGEVLIIASTDAESGAGRPVNKNGEFSHQTLAHILGGQHSEWAITGEGQTHPLTNDVYFELSETVNGAEEVARLASLAPSSNENPDISEKEENTSAEAGVIVED